MGGDLGFYCLQHKTQRGFLKLLVFSVNEDESSGYFSHQHEFLTNFSSRKGSQRVCDTGVFSRTLGIDYIKIRVWVQAKFSLV